MWPVIMEHAWGNQRMGINMQIFIYFYYWCIILKLCRCKLNWKLVVRKISLRIKKYSVWIIINICLLFQTFLIYLHLIFYMRGDRQVSSKLETQLSSESHQRRVKLNLAIANKSVINSTYYIFLFLCNKQCSTKR